MWPINSSDPERYISEAGCLETLRLKTHTAVAAAPRLATLNLYMVSEPPATVVAAPATIRAEMSVLLW